MSRFPRILSPKNLKIAMSHFSVLTDVIDGGFLSIEPRAARKFFFFYFFFTFSALRCSAAAASLCPSLSLAGGRRRKGRRGPSRAARARSGDASRFASDLSLSVQSLCSREAVEPVESVDPQQIQLRKKVQSLCRLMGGRGVISMVWKGRKILRGVSPCHGAVRRTCKTTIMVVLQARRNHAE